MINRIFILIFMLAFLALAYFGYMQIQDTQQLKAQLATQNQQYEQLKTVNDQSEIARATAAKRITELNTIAQALNNEIAALKDQIVKLMVLKTEQNKVLNENKILEAKLKQAQAINQIQYANKKDLQTKFYAENQALQAKIKALTKRVQNFEQNKSATSLDATEDKIVQENQ